MCIRDRPEDVIDAPQNIEWPSVPSAEAVFNHGRANEIGRFDEAVVTRNIQTKMAGTRA